MPLVDINAPLPGRKNEKKRAWDFAEYRLRSASSSEIAAVLRSFLPRPFDLVWLRRISAKGLIGGQTGCR